MIETFSIPPTPALARRLIHIAKLCKVHIDPALLSLADIDRIPTNDDLKIGTLRHTAIQFLADCKLRGALLARKTIDFPLEIICEAVKLTAPANSPLTIATNQGRRSGMPDHAIVAPMEEIFEMIRSSSCQWRDGVLVMEWPFFNPNCIHTSLACGLAREFPRTIIYDSLNRHSWRAIGRCLFQVMSLPQADNSSFYQREYWPIDMAPDTWHTQDQDALAYFYNVFLPKNHID